MLSAYVDEQIASKKQRVFDQIFSIEQLPISCACVCVHQAVYSDDYGVEYYKRHTSIAIRQRFPPKKNILKIKADGKDEEALRAICDVCLTMLNDGKSEDEVKKFAEDEVVKQLVETCM